MNGCQLAHLELVEMFDSSAAEFLKTSTLGYGATADQRFCLTCMTIGCEHMRLEAKLRPPWLNRQELRIMKLMMDTAPANKDLAQALDLSVTTVKSYLFQIKTKLRKAGYRDVTNRTAIAAWAVENLPSGF